jgi:putative SOS response-associated peptidase YedK
MEKDRHRRMPVVLKPDAWPAWLGEQAADAPKLKAPRSMSVAASAARCASIAASSIPAR